MFPYLSAVMPQVAYAHSVRDFIRELLKMFIPGKWIDRVISDGDATFDAKLDEALVGLDEKTATEKDYCATVVSVLCDEVSSVCEVTRRHRGSPSGDVCGKPVPQTQARGCLFHLQVLSSIRPC